MPVTTKAKALTMRKTQNDLPAPKLANIVAILNPRLADTIDLMHQAKQAHWNVKGRNFIALHKLFDDIVDAAEEYMDLIAERAVQLGGTAEGTIQIAAGRSELKEYPLHISQEQDHVAALSAALAAYGKRDFARGGQVSLDGRVAPRSGMARSNNKFMPMKTARFGATGNAGSRLGIGNLA